MPRKQTPPTAASGRPSVYSEEIAERIVLEMIEGKSIVDICAAADMPGRTTVYRWMDDIEGFGTRCARAREGQADYMDHKILKTAEDCKPETAQADRVKIAAYQWRAAKLNPKRYGDKIVNEHSGPDGGPIQTAEITDEARARALAAFLAKTAAK